MPNRTSVWPLRCFVTLFCAFLIAISLNAQTTTPNHAAANSDVEEVLTMVKAGLPEQLIIKKIQRSGKAYNLSSADLVQLQAAHTPVTVMNAMMDASPAPTAAPTTPSTPVVLTAPTAPPSGAANLVAPGQTVTPADPGTGQSTEVKKKKPGMFDGFKKSFGDMIQNTTDSMKTTTSNTVQNTLSNTQDRVNTGMQNAQQKINSTTTNTSSAPQQTSGTATTAATPQPIANATPANQAVQPAVATPQPARANTKPVQPGPDPAFQQRLTNAVSRASKDIGALQQTTARLIQQGQALPANVAEARDSVSGRLMAASVANGRGDSNGATQNLQVAENALRTIEQYLKQ